MQEVYTFVKNCSTRLTTQNAEACRFTSITWAVSNFWVRGHVLVAWLGGVLADMGDDLLD